MRRRSSRTTPTAGGLNHDQDRQGLSVCLLRQRRPRARQTEFKDCYLLVTDLTLDTSKPILPLLEKVARQGAELLIIAADVKAEALNDLVMNKRRGTVKSCAVAVAGPDQKTLLDSAATAGATSIVSSADALGAVHLSSLGRVNAVVSPEATHISKDLLNAEEIWRGEHLVEEA